MNELLNKLKLMLNTLFYNIGFEGSKYIIVAAVLTIIFKYLTNVPIAICIVYGIIMFKEFIYDNVIKDKSVSIKDIIIGVVGIMIGLL